MRLETKDTVNQPLEKIYALMRDDLAQLAPFLPNIEKIVMLEKEELKPHQHRRLNHWFAKAEIPALAKKYLKPEFFAWKDYAVWDDQEHSAEFRLESFFGKDLYEAKGKNYFRAVGDDKTEVHLCCEVTIYAQRVPGIPKFLASTILPLIEGVIVKILEPNLKSLSKGLNGYFQSKSN